MNLKFLLILFLTSLFIFSSGCKDNGNPVSSAGNIFGRWTETFEWTASPNTIHYQNFNKAASINRTSTVYLFENIFLLKVLPGCSTYTVLGDSVSTEFGKDTIAVGTFTVNGDTLSFKIDGEDSLHLFKYELVDNSLKIYCLPQKLSNGSYLVEQNEFLWGYSLRKNSGTFSKSE